ncbi:putative membrane protein [Chromohalobacter marismortui]|uniref:Putative membrane protein n=1 Tax=Chromohalobacter marismortui TaxID=42055 RepID=A0A4R7NPK9_9GAMM|nr:MULTISPECIES: DUF2069 domain-containing protein [Chromohalobacter]MCI0508918.1 DUF2069 domain-containing protein [Chromohalobacter sp.]MCI0593535.1 DUF2069 domain-containing protein [Chromohalobacter sp.]TDU22707.1 putative membrane protein [Chromohalobacter marismortui]
MRQRLDQLASRHGLSRVATLARRGVWGGMAALALLQIFGGWQLYASGQVDLMPIAVRLLPLVLFLPSVVTRRPRGHVMLAFVSLLYILQGLMIAQLPDRLAWGVLETLAALVLFVSAAAYARWRRQQLTG